MDEIKQTEEMAASQVQVHAKESSPDWAEEWS
jgi:hypothetical protein